jgi:putative flippase GtrA
MLKLLKVFHKYPTYFVVGSFVTFITIILRDIIGRFFSPYSFGYVLSIVAVYPVGIGLSYILQSRLTFQVKKYNSRENASRFFLFIATHLLGLILTIFLSIIFRYLMQLSYPNISLLKIISRDSFAYIIAVLITSIMTYIINKKVTFKKRHKY